MTTYPSGTIAVIFVAQLTGVDAERYGIAANAMVALAQKQPGYAGIDSVHDQTGLGITVSYWTEEAAAIAWRDNAEHAAIRETGRERWYSHYSLHVAEVTRSYDWVKPQ